jgi:hypothetical protein
MAAIAIYTRIGVSAIAITAGVVSAIENPNSLPWQDVVGTSIAVCCILAPIQYFTKRTPRMALSFGASWRELPLTHRGKAADQVMFGIVLITGGLSFWLTGWFITKAVLNGGVTAVVAGLVELWGAYHFVFLKVGHQEQQGGSPRITP